MADKEEQVKRSQYFIKRRFQARFVVLFIALVIVGSIISGAILYRVTYKELGVEFGRAHSQLRSTGEIILPAVLLTNVITVGVIGIATIIVTIVLSHKIAGPLYRFEKNAKKVGEGDLTVRTKLRESDQTKQLAIAFSEMTDSLREKMKDLKDKALEISKTVTDLDKNIDKTTAQDYINKEIEELTRLSSELDSALKYFKV